MASSDSCCRDREEVKEEQSKGVVESVRAYAVKPRFRVGF
jgi:hypothetical protein